MNLSPALDRRRITPAEREKLLACGSIISIAAPLTHGRVDAALADKQDGARVDRVAKFREFLAARAHVAPGEPAKRRNSTSP